MTHQEYIDQFKAFSEKIIRENEPHPDPSLNHGSIYRVASYYKDLEVNLRQIQNILKDKANELLDKSAKDNLIDTEILRNELQHIAIQSIKSIIR